MYKYDIPPTHGEVMTVARFKELVKDGSFIDYDGFGHPAKMTMDIYQAISPSTVDLIPEDATHIVWYNR